MVTFLDEAAHEKLGRAVRVLDRGAARARFGKVHQLRVDDVIAAGGGI